MSSKYDFQVTLPDTKNAWDSCALLRRLILFFQLSCFQEPHYPALAQANNAPLTPTARAIAQEHAQRLLPSLNLGAI